MTGNKECMYTLENETGFELLVAPAGSRLESITGLIYISDFYSGVTSDSSKIADDIKIGRLISLDNRAEVLRGN